MPTIVRRLTGSTSIAIGGSAVEIDIDDNWVLGATLLQFHTTGGLNSFSSGFVTGKIFQYGSTKMVRFERGHSSVLESLTIVYDIVQLTNVTVSTGTVVLTASDLQKSVTIPTVDTNQTFVLATGRHSSSSANTAALAFRAIISSSTELIFRRESASGTLTIEYFLVSSSDINYVEMRQGVYASATNDISIASVTMDRTMVLFYFSTTATLQSRHWPNASLTSTSNVRMAATAGISSISYCFYVVEWKNSAIVAVQRGSASFTSGAMSLPVTYTNPVIVNNTLIRLGGLMSYISNSNFAGAVPNRHWLRISSQLITGFTANRTETGSTANLVWEAVSFLGGGVGIPFWNHYNSLMRSGN